MKSKFLSFMTEVDPNNGNETKPGIFLWDIFKSDVIYFFVEKHFKYFNDFQNQNFLSFMTKGNPNNVNETKSEIL